MAFTRPNVGDGVSVEDFGQPAYDAIVALQTQALALPGRTWVRSLQPTNGTAGWTQISGSTNPPGDTVNARRWNCDVQISVDQAETGLPKIGYIQLFVNGSTLAGQFGVPVVIPNTMLRIAFNYDGRITGSALQISGWRCNTGFLVWNDGGPV